MQSAKSRQNSGRRLWTSLPPWLSLSFNNYSMQLLPTAVPRHIPSLVARLFNTAPAYAQQHQIWRYDRRQTTPPWRGYYRTTYHNKSMSFLSPDEASIEDVLRYVCRYLIATHFLRVSQPRFTTNHQKISGKQMPLSVFSPLEHSTQS